MSLKVRLDVSAGAHVLEQVELKKKRAKAATSTELTAQITQQLFSNLVIAGKVTAES